MGRQVQGRAKDTGGGVRENWVVRASSTLNTQTGGCEKAKARAGVSKIRQKVMTEIPTKDNEDPI